MKRTDMASKSSRRSGKKKINKKMGRGGMKFITALKNKTNNLLTEEEINIIMLNLPLRKQYLIRVYNNPVEFQSILMLSESYDSKTLLGSMIAGANEEICSLFNDSKTSAILTKKNSVQEIYCIHIYIPLCKEAKVYG